MSFEKFVLIIFTIDCIFLTFLFLWAAKKLQAIDQDREDAAKWRHGQRPIGRLLSVTEDDKGMKVEGQITDPEVWGKISGAIPGTFSIGMPKPEWEVKKAWFDIDHDDLLSMSMDDWTIFYRKVQQTWINMLRNDGYKIGETLEAQVVDLGDLFPDMKKVEFSVKVYKEGEEEHPGVKADRDWWNRKPPEGKRWITPQECHGNSAFCSTCSPRNIGRPIRNKEEFDD